MWNKNWRDEIWGRLDQEWDLIVVGGGITGAGILQEAVRMGLRTLLVEAGDFGSGTSSRSSKMVHGGLRYLKNVQLHLTYKSVRERERLMRSARGLVTPLGFLLANYRSDGTPSWLLGMGLVMYDLIALKWGHRRYDALDMHELCPLLEQEGLAGGYRYFDAQTDDARLVLRIIRQAVQEGGTALSYARAVSLLRNQYGQVCGIVLKDEAPNLVGESHERMLELKAQVVINATGAWADALRAQVEGRSRLRKLRGSHLVFPVQRLPLTRAVSFTHPHDRRFVFAFPWEGVTLVGTTDIDHTAPLDEEPVINNAEVDYLLGAVQTVFPGQELGRQDIQATFAGVRPVIGTGKTDPSKESREHVLWCEKGLLTVAGGKLTTFRLMARDALKAACAQGLKQRIKKTSSSERIQPARKEQVLESLPVDALPNLGLNPGWRLRLAGRYGQEALELAACAQPGDFEPAAGIPALWAELRWAARAEGVIHLDDLLLRRVRLGLLLPQGGLAYMERIRSTVQMELGWDHPRWEAEQNRYAQLWKQCYYLPG
jgi:glycerol-3-phosphate dehydrogenase